VKIAIIGGTGHIGTYLIPRIVDRGCHVVCLSRGAREPYQPHTAWKQVKRITIDRQAEERTGEFGEQIAALDADIVIDMICFRLDSARQIVRALQGRVQHFLHCGTIWVHGPSVEVPTTEQQPRRPFGEYGIQKAAIEEFLLNEARRNRFPATVLHPGHIVGRGWTPLNPAGHFNLNVFANLAHGREVILPNLGMETVHHVHAGDVAQAFEKSLANWSTSIGESFHIVSPAALTLRGYAERMSAWFGQEPNLRYLPWDEWRQTVSEKEATTTWDHIAHSPNCSIAKARRLLNYDPCYSSLAAVQESIQSLTDRNALPY